MGASSVDFRASLIFMHDICRGVHELEHNNGSVVWPWIRLTIFPISLWEGRGITEQRLPCDRICKILAVGSVALEHVAEKHVLRISTKW